MMKSLLSVLTLAFLITDASSAFAVCYGGDAFTSCSDDAGNNYTINKFPNATTIQGNNTLTGAHWNEIVQINGNTTYSNGSINGSPWNMLETNSGGVKTVNGIGAQGQLFSYMCNPQGVCTGYP